MSRPGQFAVLFRHPDKIPGIHRAGCAAEKLLGTWRAMDDKTGIWLR
jgi:hypothetical protein